MLKCQDERVTFTATVSPCVGVGMSAFANTGHWPESYSITSSASASTYGGMVSPMAFAVFEFGANRYCVGSSNGKSAGLVPLNSRSTIAAARSTVSFRSGPYDINPPSRNDCGLQAIAERITATQECRPGRRAHWLNMELFEPRPTLSKLVDIRRLDVGAVEADVFPAQVIGHNVHDVRARR